MSLMLTDINHFHSNVMMNMQYNLGHNITHKENNRMTTIKRHR